MVWSPPLVFAKKVKIQWKEMEGAVDYEIQIQREGKKPFNKYITGPSPDSEWKGELEPGAYTYQIRGIDPAKRAGQWSEARNLAVMPQPLKLKFPVDGRHIELYHPNVPTVLRWERSPGIRGYRVDLRRDGKLISQTEVNDIHLELKKMPPGHYSWRVVSIVHSGLRSGAFPGGRTPASQQGKKWESEASREEDFRIEYRELAAPFLVGPVSSEPPPEDSRIKLSWKSVEGAELYEVHLLRLSARGASKGSSGRSPASDLQRVKRIVTSENSMTLRVPGEGRYVWGVRALANLEDPVVSNAPKIALATGPESVAEFSLDRNAIFNEDLGYLAFSTMLALYQYKIKSPSTGGGGSIDSVASVFRLSGELWLLPQWGISTAVEYVPFSVQGKSFAREDFELLVKYRLKISSGQFGWSVSPKLGFEIRNYNKIVASNNQINSGLIGMDEFFLGASLGIDVRKQFNDRFSLGAKIGYFVPLSILTGPPGGSTMSSVASYSNLSAGVQGLYWLNRNWAVALGGFYDFRAISFNLPGASGPEEIHMDAGYFFGSIIFRFWK